MRENTLDAVNLELLRTFVVAAAGPTFAEAARTRGISVSAISQQVKALETQLGLLLFERIGRRVRLTPEGRRLADAVQVQLGAVAEVLAEVTGAGSRLEGRVVLGGPRTFGAHFVTPRLVALLRRTPGLHVDQQFEVPSVLERRLLDGALDFAILSRPAGVPGLEVAPMATETFLAVVSAALLSRLGPARDEAALKRWPWLVFDQDLPMHTNWWRASFGRPAAHPEVVAASLASLEHLQAFAEAGLGVVVLPDYLVADALTRRRLVRVEAGPAGRPPRPARNTLLLAWRRGAPASRRALAVKEALLQSLPATRDIRASDSLA